MPLSFVMAGVWIFCFVFLAALAGTDILGDVHVFFQIDIV